MSAVKTYFAGAAFVTFVASVPGLFLPDRQADMPSAPIEVHELAINVDHWTVTQDRTITSRPGMPDGSPVAMEWAARIERISGGTIDHCSGSGRWPYAPGDLRVDLSVPNWTGSDTCTIDAVPRDVPLRLVAAWWTVDGETVPVTAMSAPFVISSNGAMR